jgi:D-beta-D-heptose 7-phosphate kinase/D-beta-D-heptose 1-phosphate adenosyltransferase
VSDYAKGMVTDKLLTELPVGFIADPKRKDLTKYNGAYIITPNQHEFETSKFDPSQLILVTMSGAGAILRHFDKHQHFPVRRREFGDTTGCGDSFIAGLAFSLSIGIGLDDAIRIANAAGAIAFDHVGAHAVSLDEINEEMNNS